MDKIGPIAALTNLACKVKITWRGKIMVSANAIGSGYESEFFNLLNLELGQAFSQNLYNRQRAP
tara:strand:- start:263 stop:454 length:192 start_codon:yes stop_codon:yes gene_type:complete